MLIIKLLIRKKPKIIKRVKGVNFVDGFIDNYGIYHPIKGEEKIKIPSEKSDEFKMAVWIKENLGGRIDMVPEIETAKGAKQVCRVSTPDYIWDGEKWDYKEPNGAGSRTIEDLIKKKKRQAHNFIIRIDKLKLSEEEIVRQYNKIFISDSTKFVDKIIFLNNNEILLTNIKAKKSISNPTGQK